MRIIRLLCFLPLGREWMVMYGVDDHMAFYLSIKHPSAFCDEAVGVHTFHDRCNWQIGTTVTIAWGGKPVSCKIHAFGELQFSLLILSLIVVSSLQHRQKLKLKESLSG